MKIIDGRKIAAEIRLELKEKVGRLQGKPGLAILLAGDDPGSHIYVGLKEKAAKDIGIDFHKFLFPADTRQREIEEKIRQLNQDKDVDGIVVQFPLPNGLNKDKMIRSILPAKDVDGFHPENLELLRRGRPRIVPGLSAGIIRLIKSTAEPLHGKHMVVVANSRIFSEPIGVLLEPDGVTSELISPDHPEMSSSAERADILVAAVGQPGFIKSEYIKKGAIVIDVGYSRIGGKPSGDVDFDSVKEKAGWVTPVPGGVGPVTVEMLLANVVKVYEKKTI